MSIMKPASGEGSLPRMEELNKLIKKLESDPSLIKALKNDKEFRKFASEYKQGLDEFVKDTILRLEMLARIKDSSKVTMDKKKK